MKPVQLRYGYNLFRSNYKPRKWVGPMYLESAFGIEMKTLRKLRRDGTGPEWVPDGDSAKYDLNKFKKWFETEYAGMKK